MNNTITALRELKDCLNKLDNKIEFSVDFYDSVNKLIQSELEIEQLNDLFEFDIRNHWYYTQQVSCGYIKFSQYDCLILMGEQNGRTISWSDNGEQPVNEWLYKIGFPEGAYVFHHNHYFKELFQQFFEELKQYNPKFVDTANKLLYFDYTSAKNIVDEWKLIFEEYKKKTSEYIKKKEIEDLEKKLTELKDN